MRLPSFLCGVALWGLGSLPLSPQGTHAAPPASTSPVPHRWTLDEFGGVLSVGLEGNRSFKAGKELFFSTKCADCHRFVSWGQGDATPLTRLVEISTPEEVLGPILSNPAHRKGETAPTDFLTQEQVLDLLAFLLSSGNPASPLFFGSR
ncbi:MAG: hypothetical protein RLZZ399_1304 [Verrucomicrobiota bacterium]